MANLQIIAANKSIVEAQYVEMKVPLYSYGCEKKIKKALAHLKGIYSINVDFEEQKVTVWGICNKLDVLANIRSKRKGARFWKPEDNTELLEAMALQKLPESSDHLDLAGHPSPKAHSPNPLALALIKFRPPSLSWKSWKKFFIRSYSF